MFKKIQQSFQRYRENGWTDTVDALVDQTHRVYWRNKYHFSPRRLFIPLQKIEIKKPVFFLGVQGGGLTLLTRMIRRHPTVVMAASNANFWAGPDEIDKFYPDMPDELALRSPGYENLLGTEENHPFFGLERSWTYATNSLLPYYRKTGDDWNPTIAEIFKNKIKTSIRSYASNPYHARFVDKSQSYTVKIPFLRQCFDDAKFVLVLRNPYAMCWREATTKLNKYEHWNIKPTLEAKVSFAAEHWTNTFQTALTDLMSDENHHILKFEAFLQNPKQQLKKILQFLELDFFPEMLPRKVDKIPLGSQDRTKWYPIRTNINNRYLSEITPQACDIIETYAGEIAQKFDYKRPK